MSELSEIDKKQALSAPARPAGGFVLRWMLGWVLAMLASASLVLLMTGAAPVSALLALSIIGLPGAIGAVWRPKGGQAVTYLALWALAAVVAARLEGGVGGPFAIWYVMPLVAAVVIEAPWMFGLSLAAASFAAVGVIDALHPVWRARPDVSPGGLTLIAILTTAGAALAAFYMARARVPTQAVVSDGPESTAPVAVTGEATADLAARLDASEAARRKAEADAEGRARFLANMSHELRTPLNAIMGFSDIMRNRMFGDLQPKYLEYAELIHESGRHLLDLINDVLDMSKIEARRYELSLETFDVREAVSAALRLMRLQADDAGVRLRGVLPAEPLMVDADRRAIKQVVLNLVSNALKFTPAGGEVTLSLGAAQGMMELVVADTGVGIASEDLERLGRPYQQAGGANERAQGTGLGLSLVRAFAELHGGQMSLESRLGEGTAVTVRLPVLGKVEPSAEPRG